MRHCTCCVDGYLDARELDGHDPRLAHARIKCPACSGNEHTFTGRDALAVIAIGLNLGLIWWAVSTVVSTAVMP